MGATRVLIVLSARSVGASVSLRPPLRVRRLTQVHNRVASTLIPPGSMEPTKRVMDKFMSNFVRSLKQAHAAEGTADKGAHSLQRPIRSLGAWLTLAHSELRSLAVRSASQVVEGAPDSVTSTISTVMRVHGWDFYQNDAWSVRHASFGMTPETLAMALRQLQHNFPVPEGEAEAAEVRRTAARNRAPPVHRPLHPVRCPCAARWPPRPLVLRSEWALRRQPQGTACARHSVRRHSVRSPRRASPAASTPCVLRLRKIARVRRLCLSSGPPAPISCAFSQAIDEDHMPTEAELADVSLASEKLWALDTNRLEPNKDYRIRVKQGRSSFTPDESSNETLFSYVDDSIFDKR